VTALEAANLVDTLKSQGPFTVFAPTDEAFGRLPEGTVEGLLEDTPALTDVLLYHMVSGDVRAADLAEMETVDTLLEEPLAISIENGEVRINESQVVTADIEASNGVIHVIDSVLLPAPSPTGNGQEHPSESKASN
jgi:transforming growth factor-beta-induced protein